MGGAGVCGLAGLGGGLSVLVDGNLLIIADLKPALDHRKSSALAGACVAVWVDEEGVWVEFTNVIVLTGDRRSLGEGEGGVEDWESDDSCPAREVVGSSSSLRASSVITFLSLFMVNRLRTNE